MIRALVGWLPRLPLSAWLLCSHTAVLLPPVVVLLLSGTLTNDLRDQTRWDIEHQGALIATYLQSELEHARRARPGADLDDIEPRVRGPLRDAKESTLSGIRVVDARAKVVATSGDVLGEDLSSDPIVQAALDGRTGVEVRPRPEQTEYHPPWSESRSANVRVYVAIPVVLDQRVVGAVVISRTPREQFKALYHMAPGLVAAVVAAVFATAGVAGLAAWVATRSLEMLDRGALRIADGDHAGLDELDRPRRSHVSEVAHTANSIATMAERLRDRLSYISEFASNVSHEFKTPIATLRGTVELLTDDAEMPAEQRARFLDNAGRELSRLERMVSGLLSLARADEPHARAEVGLGELLADVAADHAVALSGEAAAVRGDRAQLEAVAKNLVENARRHGGPGVAVQLEGFVDGRATGFRVIDDGRGISDANLARVFDRFFTTDRASGGTGLGLALVRTIAQRHGGDVNVDSRPGRTVFTVRLPRA
ncbi:MAG: HAMP domain-containing sensor histidine kinase [Myxococcota bacterium]